MLTLILFRHAKSSWDRPELQDFDRPLAERGRKAAPRMAACIAREGLVPDRVLCSAARRTRDTLNLAIGAWEPRPAVEYADALYMVGPDMLLRAVRAAPADARRLMVIGHNPGLEAFALMLTGHCDARMRSAMATKFPTAAFAAIDFDAADWSGIAPRQGWLTHFVTPRQLDERK
jgi:phosphohistidine phosphatase